MFDEALPPDPHHPSLLDRELPGDGIVACCLLHDARDEGTVFGMETDTIARPDWESFPLEGDRLTIGRRPESDIFLDDVTVSRDHALIVRRGDEHHLDDLGSLNGTYVNRRRIDSHHLEDGDEIQVGKYKLTFLGR